MPAKHQCTKYKNKSFFLNLGEVINETLIRTETQEGSVRMAGMELMGDACEDTEGYWCSGCLEIPARASSWRKWLVMLIQKEVNVGGGSKA